MTPSNPQSRNATPLVEQVLLGLCVLGGIAILSLPDARAAGGAFGWMPLWLTLLPATAYATAVALRRAREAGADAIPARLHRRRSSIDAAVPARRGQGMAVRRRRAARAA